VNEQEIKDKPKDKDLEVTVRTPAGASAQFEFKDNTKVQKAIKIAVDYFVGKGELTDGDYGLALARHGTATELPDDTRLDDDGVVDGDVLHLINRAPQVDG
jgi:hypothetical protein